MATSTVVMGRPCKDESVSEWRIDAVGCTGLTDTLDDMHDARSSWRTLSSIAPNVYSRMQRCANVTAVYHGDETPKFATRLALLSDMRMGQRTEMEKEA